jgi:hypothetical protein
MPPTYADPSLASIVEDGCSRLRFGPYRGKILATKGTLLTTVENAGPCWPLDSGTAASQSAAAHRGSVDRTGFCKQASVFTYENCHHVPEKPCSVKANASICRMGVENFFVSKFST